MKEAQQDDRLNFWTMNKIEQKTGTKKRIRFASKIKLSLLLKFWLTTCLSRKTSVTDWTFEGPLFGVGSVMNFKRRLASKNLEANLAGRVAARCKKAKNSGFVTWVCGSNRNKFPAFERLKNELVWVNMLKLGIKHFWLRILIDAQSSLALTGSLH